MKTEFAVISPSTALTGKFKEVIGKRRLACSVIQASQDNAVPAAQNLVKQGVRVIISRGNTAQVLRQTLNIPVIDEKHTFFDCFLCYQKARKISERIAFLSTSDGFTEILEKSKEFLEGAYICPMNLQMGWEYIEKRLRELEAMGIQVVVGGLTLEKIAVSLGFSYIMTEADYDSVNAALDEALYQLEMDRERRHHQRQLEQRYEMINSIMNCASDGIFSVDRDGILLNANEHAKKLLPGLLTGKRVEKELFKRYFLPVLQSGEKMRDELISIGQNSLVLNIAPITVEEAVHGAVATVWRQTDIQKAEQKIRRRLMVSGYISDKTFDDIIGTSPAMEETKALARRYAKVDSTVLLLGETGTGKEVFAQSIHNASARKDAPFVAINCAAFPASILESELFGYVKGAFTGAKNEGKAGVFELAHSGTIFLDEISETPLEVQLKLLRVIQERKVNRLGDDRLISVDVRIIAASNRNLEQLVREGKFREDFYYRICVLELHIPPLDARKGDISQLARYFLKNSSYPERKITEEALLYLKNMSWHGNVRQLSNMIERLSVICDSETITEEMVIRAAEGFKGYREAQTEKKEEKQSGKSALTEEELLRRTLCQCRGNRDLAAKRLGISKTTLWRKMKKIQEKEPKFFELVQYGQ